MKVKNIILFVCLFVIANLVFINYSYAGRIALRTDISVTNSADDKDVLILVTTKNAGDIKDPSYEEAKNVYPVVYLLGKTFPKNDLQVLIPTKSYKWNVVIPKSELNFTSEGTYPIIVKVLYQDRNGANFSNIFDSRYTYKKDTVLNVDGKLENVTLPEDAAAEPTETKLSLISRLEKEADVNLSYYFPDEIIVLEPTRKIKMTPNSMKDIAIKLKNFKGLNGSDYEVKVIMEHDDGKQHFSSTTKGFVHISAEESFINQMLSNFWFYIAIGVILIIIAILLIPSKKKSEKK